MRAVCVLALDLSAMICAYMVMNNGATDMAKNIRNETDRNYLTSLGYHWVTVVPRGETIGRIKTAHKEYRNACKRARDRDLAIIEICYGDTF